MFEFLHGLGEELQEDSSPASMHRYVVNGVAGVIEADAGILYLLDGETDRLVPIYQTRVTAPVIPAPREVVENRNREEARKKFRAHLRLSPQNRGTTFVGRVLDGSEVIWVPDLVAHEFFEGPAVEWQKDVRLLAAPLVYGRKRVGVILMTRNGGRPFSRNDRDVFASVSEQSAFALGSAIIHAEAHEKRRLENELKQASEIQKVLLPRNPPELSDYRLASAYLAARHVSGDYFDYLPVGEDRFGVAIGDVCGKGIAASLIVAMCRSNLRSRAGESDSPSEVLHQVNRLIFPDIKQDMFVSLLYLVLEKGSNELTLARAGHEPPLIYRKARGEVEVLEVPGMAAGVDSGTVFQRSVRDHRLQLDPGDILVLYTDGIIEAENREGDEYGLDRLRETLCTMERLDADSVVGSIMDDVRNFTRGAQQSDDITLIAVEKR